jgi:hypothetical protein
LLSLRGTRGGNGNCGLFVEFATREQPTPSLEL